MTREEHFRNIKELFIDKTQVLLRLPTSFGKSKIAIDLLKEVLPTSEVSLFKRPSVLIVVPKLVLIDTWKDELRQWEFPLDDVDVTFSTYVSYPKHVSEEWTAVIFDECHHFTENCCVATELLSAQYIIAMSATIPKEPKWRLKDAFSRIREYSVTAREAINEEILPDPKVLLIPMVLNNQNINEVIEKNKSKSGTPIEVFYRNRRSVLGIRNRPIHIKCTQAEYYQYTSEMIEWWKSQYMTTQQPYQRNQWLRLSKDRLKWLAEKKEPFVKRLLEFIANYRVLTFCTSIAQTESLGKYCIHSQNSSAMQYLEAFNNGSISHITACGVLNEGVNLKNCQIGVYANIGSSEIIEIQRLGRILRHKNPLIIIPFYVGTREEEIVKKMLRNYNNDLVITKFTSEINENTIKEIIEWNPED